MRLILHTGAHYTEQERLMKSILRNKEMLRARGMAVPGPGRYRTLMRDTLNALHRQAPSENAREILLDAILDEEPAERVLLSDPNFFRTPGTAVQAGRLYPAAASRMAHMAALFPEDEIEIFIAMRNPAALLPIFHGVSLDPSEGAFWGGRAPQEIRWSTPCTTSAPPCRRCPSPSGATRTCRCSGPPSSAPSAACPRRRRSSAASICSLPS